MDGRIDVGMDEWKVDGWTDGKMDRYGWMDGHVVWMDGRWMEERMDRWIDR